MPSFEAHRGDAQSPHRGGVQSLDGGGAQLQDGEGVQSLHGGGAHVLHGRGELSQHLGRGRAQSLHRGDLKTLHGSNAQTLNEGGEHGGHGRVQSLHRGGAQASRGGGAQAPRGVRSQALCGDGAQALHGDGGSGGEQVSGKGGAHETEAEKIYVRSTRVDVGAVNNRTAVFEAGTHGVAHTPCDAGTLGGQADSLSRHLGSHGGVDAHHQGQGTRRHGAYGTEESQVQLTTRHKLIRQEPPDVPQEETVSCRVDRENAKINKIVK